MNPIKLPDALAGRVTPLTPMQLNRIRFVSDHTVLTPELLQKMQKITTFAKK